MKVSALILILIPWQIIFSQNTNNQLTNTDFESLIIGEWLLKGSEVDSSFEFSTSENGIINCQIHQYLEKDNAVTEIIHNTTVVLTKNDLNYLLKWESSKFHWKGEIEKMTDQKFFLKINSNVLKFVRK